MLSYSDCILFRHQLEEIFVARTDKAMKSSELSTNYKARDAGG